MLEDAHGSARLDFPEDWASLDTCAVSDALDQLGQPGVVHGIAPLTGSTLILGRAVTVELSPATGATPSRHLGTKAVEVASPGDVIVVANRGRLDCASWGGNLSLAAHLAGVAGVVVDGACRDLSESAALGFPIFARSATPRTARGRVIEASCQQPVIFGDVIVHPGDIVIGDSNGIVFVRQEAQASVLAAAAQIVQKEAAMATAIRSGISITQVMGTAYEQLIAPNAERSTS